MENTTTLKLTAWERVILAGIIRQQGAKGVGEMRRWLSILDAIALSDENKEFIGWHEEGNGAASWDEEKRNHEFEVQLPKADAKLLAGKVAEATLPVSEAALALLEKLESI